MILNTHLHFTEISEKDTSFCPLFVHDSVTTLPTSDWISSFNFIFLVTFCKCKWIDNKKLLLLKSKQVDDCICLFTIESNMQLYICIIKLRELNKNEEKWTFYSTNHLSSTCIKYIFIFLFSLICFRRHCHVFFCLNMSWIVSKTLKIWKMKVTSTDIDHSLLLPWICSTRILWLFHTGCKLSW